MKRIIFSVTFVALSSTFTYCFACSGGANFLSLHKDSEAATVALAIIGFPLLDFWSLCGGNILGHLIGEANTFIAFAMLDILVWSSAAAFGIQKLVTRRPPLPEVPMQPTPRPKRSDVGMTTSERLRRAEV